MAKLISHRSLIVCLLCSIVFGGCNPGGNTSSSEGDVLLAEVYDRKLLLSDVLPLLIDPATPEDSASQVRNHVETWVREELLLHEAERKIPADVNIDQLVEDYRSSLLISTYENVLVKTLLDTVVTDSELKDFYTRNKEQYRLETAIIRCQYVKLKKPVPQREQFQRLWLSKKPDDLTALVVYSQSNAADFILQDSTWYRQADLEMMMPPRSFNGQSLYPGKVLRGYDGDYEYALRIVERIAANEIAPLSYVGEQARRFILHKRKIDLLQKIKSDLYSRELDGLHVKVHI